MSQLKQGDLVRIDTIPDAPLREVIGVKENFILINYGGWVGWVPAEVYQYVLSGTSITT